MITLAPGDLYYLGYKKLNNRNKTRSCLVLRHSECFGGRWACTKDVCSKTCSVLGYQHFQTFDGKTFEFHGPESSFVLVEVSPLPAAAAFVANESVPTQLARCWLARCWFPRPAVSSAKT